MSENEGHRHPLGVALAVSGAAVAGTIAAVAAKRAVVRRLRSPLAERPGTARRVRSFDGSELAVNVVGPLGGAGRNAAGSDHRAPTLVFAHGFSLDMTSWHYQWKRFSLRHRCVLFDQRGHGLSGPARGGGYSLDALGHDLKAVLDAEVPEGPAIVFGHSMGGVNILALAAQYPEEFGRRIRAAVLASTAAADVMKDVLAGVASRLGRLLVPLPRRLIAHPERLHDIAFLITRLTNFGSHAPPSVVEYVAQVAARTRATVWANFLASLATLDLEHALDHIRVPALVLVGDHDCLTPPATALAMTRRLPYGRMVVLPGAGHCGLLEHHDDFNAAIEEFLRTVPAQVPDRPSTTAPAARRPSAMERPAASRSPRPAAVHRGRAGRRARVHGRRRQAIPIR